MSKKQLNMEIASPNSSDTLLIVDVLEPRGVKLPAFPESSEPDEIEGKQLIPGENNVTQGCWEVAKKNPSIKIWLAADVIKCRGEGKAKSLLNSLDTLPLRKAETSISKLDDVKALNRLKDGTTKSPHKKLINKRINEIVAKA